MIVPLSTAPGSFLLVCDRFFTVYSNAYDGYIQCLGSFDTASIEICAQVNEGLSFLPLWVAWTRSLRSDGEEQLYLAREEGSVIRLNISKASRNVQVVNVKVVANYHRIVDTIFTIVDLSQKGQPTEEAFLIGGDMGNGSLHVVS